MNKNFKINKASYWLMEVASEIESIATSTIGEKYKIMLFMTYIDILSKIWSVHTGDTNKKQKNKFRTWSDTFIFNDLNEVFLNLKDEILPLNSEILYKIRNSLIHFSALPNINEIIIFISSDSKSEFCNIYAEKIKEKEEQVLLLTPKILAPLIVNAGILTINEFNKDNIKYEATLLKIFALLEKESAMKIHSCCNT